MIRSLFSPLVLASISLLSPQWGMGPGPGTAHTTGGGLNPCLISAWAMNEGSGLTLHDTSTGGTNTATISGAGAVTWQSNAGLPGTTPLWTGSGNGLATSSTLTNFTGTTAFSIAGWFTITSANATFVGDLNPSSNFIGWEVQESGNSVYFNLINAFSGNTIQVHSTAPFGSGLHYIVVTYDGSQSTSGVKIYEDGASVSISVDHGVLSATTASGLPTRFGARSDGTNEYAGAMAFVGIYNCVVTSTQVSTYNASGPGIY